MGRSARIAASIERSDAHEGQERIVLASTSATPAASRSPSRSARCTSARKVPLHKWLAATHLMMASKKGMSALQVGRMLGISKKTAWFLCHRIRESLRETEPRRCSAAKDKTVEVDETYRRRQGEEQASQQASRKGTGGVGKEAVFALVERGGSVRSHPCRRRDRQDARGPILEAQIACSIDCHDATKAASTMSGP